VNQAIERCVHAMRILLHLNNAVRRVTDPAEIIAACTAAVKF